ncbi:MAG: DegV family protein [Firmicutes bacterium]|nr:DegV family protein [Bacillota bacterium]
MNIKITADSTCDLSPQIIAEQNIDLVPLYVNKDGSFYRDGVDITPADIFAHVAAGGSLCSTAACNVEDYARRFQPLSQQYDGVIHISLGGDFSSSYQNACIAAADYPNVRVIDSRNLSTGQGHVVMEACKLAKTMDDLDAIAAELNDLTGRVETSFLLDRLDYMVKGGRCSMVAALGANLLQLKPSIEVADGKMRVCKKYRGSFSKSIVSYVKDRLKDRDDIIRDRVFITHTPCDDKALAAVRRTVDEYGRFPTVMETNAGCTISCHCGPGCLGVLFIRKKQS